MAKGQKRSSKELRKPKQPAPKPAEVVRVLGVAQRKA
ncbi:hypothetical protein [Phenylobacterium sp.]|nr:hypothetical protein [Phenylobacterium sp.]